MTRGRTVSILRVQHEPQHVGAATGSVVRAAYFGALVEMRGGGCRRPIKIPLPEIQCKDVIDIDAYTAHQGAGVRRGVDYALIEHCRGFACTKRPRLRLPHPPPPSTRRVAHYAVFDGPCTHAGVPVNGAAVHAQYRVDASKPLDANTVPGGEMYVLVDAEEDGCGVRTPGGSMQPQRGAGVFGAAAEPAGEIRRRGSARLAVLEVAHHMEALVA